jgi:3-oxoacyl-[acyl-carrier protein] reductase
MTRFFACSLAPQTKVNAIAPGSFVLKDRNENYYETNSLLKRSIENFLPLGKMPTVDDIALIVGFLVSEKNKILNGQILDLSGGYLGLEPSQVFSKLSQ